MKRLLVFVMSIRLIFPVLCFGQTAEAERYYEQAQQNEENKDYNEAIVYYTKAIESGIEFAYFKRGFVKEAYLNDVDGALKDYTIYIDKGGTYPWLLKSRADIYYAKNMYKEALDDYLTSIRYNQDESFGKHRYGSIGYCRLRLEDYKGAIIDFNKVIELNPNNAQAYYYRGVAKEKSEEPYCSDYKKACELGENEACEWYNKQCK